MNHVHPLAVTRPRQASRGRTANGQPNPIDVHVGRRMRLRRTLLGLSQDKLAEALGLTFQQVQKYERGANRMGASRLFDLAHALDVPVAYFFDDMDAAVAAASPKALRAGAPAPDMNADPLHSRDLLELARDYHTLDDATRLQIRRMVATIAESQRNARGGEG